MIKLFCLFLVLSKIISSQTLFEDTLIPDKVEDWTSGNPPEIYRGEDLYRLINGGADIFLEYGFNSVVTRRYQNKNEKIISAEVYEMKDSSSAYGIFSLFTLKTGASINFASGASEGDEFLIFYNNKYYITISGHEVSEEVKEGISLIADKINGKLRETEKPELAEIFLETDSFKVVYLKGSLALYNLDSFDFLKNLEIKEAVFLNREESSYLIVKYDSEEKAYRNFLSLKSDLAPGSILIQHQESEGEFFEFENNAGKVHISNYLKDYIIVSIRDMHPDYGLPYIYLVLNENNIKSR